MRYLVTGATGLVGNNVTRLLLARGDSVRVLTRATSAARPLADLDVEIVQGELRDAASVEQAMQGIDRVIHAAAYSHIGWLELDASRAINVAGTANVAASARRAGARLVHVSTVDTLGILSDGQESDEDTPVDGKVLCSYVVSKREAEQAVLAEVAKGLAATIVNPGFMIGPWDWKPSSGRMLLAVSRNLGLMTPAGTSHFCDVRDVVEAILSAADRGAVGRRYILAGERLTYFQAFRIFASATSATAPLFSSDLLMRFAGAMGDLCARLTGREPDLNSATAAIFSQQRNFVSTRAKRELGYRPRPLAEAAEAAWQWFLEHGYAKQRPISAPHVGRAETHVPIAVLRREHAAR